MPKVVTCPNQHEFTLPDEESTQTALRCPTCHVHFSRSGSQADSERSLTSTVSLGDARKKTSTTVSADARLPQVKGYELRKKLGEGGMGSVFLARQVEADRQVALKLIRPDRLSDGNHQNTIERLRVEARATARLEHDHIVPVYDVGEFGGTPFFSMRYIEGSSLQDLLQRGPLPGREASRRLEPVARALHAAHEKGVLHRDIKPANLLWDYRTERLLIADFGLAKLMADSRLTLEGEVFGSPAYMSPEQALGKEVNARSDVYSLGATLYQAITGRPPFQGESVPQTLRMVVEDEPVSPRILNSAIDRDLEKICLKCLQKNPYRRYASAAALADDLQRYLEHRPVKARPIGPIQHAARWCRRHPAMAASFGVLAAASLVAVFYLQTRPAFLRINVAPSNARVLLDGEPLEIDEGTALIESTPGRHKVTVSAPKHQTLREGVLLARGRGNMAVLDVDLVPLAGRLHLTSDPSGAEVSIRDSQERVVAEGFTPFISDAIPSGRYTVFFAKNLYEPLKTTARVPDGNQTLSLDKVTLRPETDGAKRYDQLQQLHRSLMQKLEQPLRFQQVPLQAITRQLGRVTELQIDIDRQALADAGIATDQPSSGTFQAGPFYTSANRFLQPYGLVLRPVIIGESMRAEVSTIQDQGEIVTILYPVGELVSPLRQDWDSLLQNVYAGVLPRTWEHVGGPASVRPNRNLMALSIRHNWDAHLKIFEYLRELQRRQLAGQSEGLIIKSADEQAAVNAAQRWLNLIDEGKYEESWNQASIYLQRQFNLKRWTRARKATPHPTTRQNRRRLDQVQFLPKAPPGMGEVPAVMLRFRSASADYDLYEVVVLAKLDGNWQPTGYQISQAPANPVAPIPRQPK